MTNKIYLSTGQKVYAHKVILSTRSDVMAAMFSGNFMESKKDQISEVETYFKIKSTFIRSYKHAKPLAGRFLYQHLC